MFERIRKWNHRQMVKSTASSVKHWKQELYWPLFVMAVIIFTGFLFIFNGNWVGLVMFGVGASFLAWYWKMTKVRNMSESERIQFFATWNRINPDEVSAFLAEKQKSDKVS